MNKRLSFTISSIVAFTLMAAVAYYLLLTDNFLHISIASIIHTSHHLAVKTHLLILGLLPIYIAGLIFGAILISLYISPKIENFLLVITKSNQPLS